MGFPLAVIPGTGVGPVVASMYRPWMSTRGDRIFPLPGRGLDALNRTYEHLEDQLLGWFRETRKRFVLAGHSQGAYHSVRFALCHPNMVAGVVGVGGPFGGALQPPFIPSFVDNLVHQVVPVAADFKKDSYALRNLAQHVENVWPEDVPLTLVAGHRDQLVRPRRSAHSLQCEPIKLLYVGPWRPTNLPAGVGFAFAPLAGHTSQIFMPPVLRLIREACGR